MRKKLFAILLCLAIAVGIMPAVAMAEESEQQTEIITQQFLITKEIQKSETAATPPAETFEFVLEDVAEEKQSLEYYGITLLDELKISTDGVGLFDKTVNVQINLRKVNNDYGWNGYGNAGSQDIRWYSKTFNLVEKNDSRDGWEYSSQGYAVTFKYTLETGEMTCLVHERGNDVTFNTAKFTNTYTKQEQIEKIIELPFTVTVKQGGNVAPGKQAFELEIFDIGNSNEDEYNDMTCTAKVETNGNGDYNAKLIIEGPEDQVERFTCEGFYVREKDTKAANWTYSDAVWFVSPIDSAAEKIYTIYPAELKNSDNGEYYEFDRENPAERMTFVNIYTENKTMEPTQPEKPTKPEDPKSPQTGDNNMMGLWIVLLLVSGGAVAGSITYFRKRKA